MHEIQRYHVLPQALSLQPVPDSDSVPLNDYEKKEIKNPIGVAGFFVAAFSISSLIWVVSAVFGQSAPALSVFIGVCVAAFIVAFLHVLVHGRWISEKAREKAQREKHVVESRNQAAISRAEGEARNLTSELTRTYESSAVTAAELPQHLAQAQNWIRKADGEFKDNAFGPFWDAVEYAAQQIAAFNAKANHLSSAAGRYYVGLNGRTHTFPSFPTTSGNFPDPIPVLNDLRRVVRMGETNFQFANIWEHRRTREAMIAGFHTLGEAVNNLESVVGNSLGSLQHSISSDMARMVQEQISTRDSLDRRMVEQNRMLDNIQHRRQPGGRDGPSRY